MSAKPENERREEIVNLIATAAMVCVTPHLKHMISFNTLCEAVSAALPPLPQQGDIAQRESGGDEPVAWRVETSEGSAWFYAEPDTQARCAEEWAENRWRAIPLYAAPPASQAPRQVDPETIGDVSSLIAARCVALPGALVDCPVCGAVDKERERLAAQAMAEPVAWREAYARKLAELKGHRDLEHEIICDDGSAEPVWRLYLKDADALLAIHALPAPAEAQARVVALEAFLREIVDWMPGVRAPHRFSEARAKAAALLSGSTPKPAGVEIDDAMIERALNAQSPTGSVVRQWFTARLAPKIMRAALTAALSGDAG